MAFTAAAQGSSNFEYLNSINKEWGKRTMVAIPDNYEVKSDREWIQMHLRLVANYLEASTASTLIASQRTNRADLIQVLRGYANKGVFPTNHYHAERRPYFVDNYGVHCAVGFLMKESGATELVAQIRRDHNYDYIRDIKTEGVSEWAEEHGFTVDELAWIQPSYPASTPMTMILNGTNGTVNKVVDDFFHGGLILAGDFDTLDQLPCLNIGVYQNDQLSCLGGGIDGVVSHIGYKYGYDKYVVFGSFNNNGVTYPVATYDGVSWTYMEIPNRSGAVSNIGSTSTHFDFEVAIEHPSIPNSSEIWAFDNGMWQHLCTVNGPVYANENSDLGRVYAGHFDTVVVYNGSGTIIDTLETNNFAYTKYPNYTWYGHQSTAISDTVRSIESVPGGQLYFGGTSGGSNVNNVSLTRYLNGVMQPLNNLSPWSGYPPSTIYALKYVQNESAIYIGGYYSYIFGMGDYGMHIGKYHIVTNGFEILGYPDSTVYSIELYNGEIYLGGAFTEQYGTTLNHLAKIDYSASLTSMSLEDNVAIYPNPVQDQFVVSFAQQDNMDVNVYDINGKLIDRQTGTHEINFNSSDWNSGVYIVSIKVGDAILRKRVVKN